MTTDDLTTDHLRAIIVTRGAEIARLKVELADARAELGRAMLEGREIEHENNRLRALAACAALRAAVTQACAMLRESHLPDLARIIEQRVSTPAPGAGCVVLTREEAEKMVDAILFAVCDCHDGAALWDHSRRDPEAFRSAVRDILRGKEKP